MLFLRVFLPLFIIFIYCFLFVTKIWTETMIAHPKWRDRDKYFSAECLDYIPLSQAKSSRFFDQLLLRDRVVYKTVTQYNSRQICIAQEIPFNAGVGDTANWTLIITDDAKTKTLAKIHATF
jgi:hypothetical protein